MGKTDGELVERLDQVLTRFDKSGLRLRKDKCKFGVTSVEFLGYKLDSLGIRPLPEKIKAIKNAPVPHDKKQLQAFLGLLNFYHAFLPHKATVAEPLHRLLDKNCRWRWTSEHQQAFDSLKGLITSDRVLVHYNGKLPLVVTCDASPYGIGSVLSHRMPDGTERPIAFYSRTLSKPERNYAQIDREAVALVSGVKKFHDYLYGRKFELVTDHRPLVGIFNSEKPIPTVISNQMLRRRIFLNAYDYKIVYRPGHKIANADFLSRFPMAWESPTDDNKDQVLMIEVVANPILDAKRIASQTAKNPDLAKVLNWALRGWPDKVARSDKLYPFYVRRTEISALKGCLLWGNRIIIPPGGRQVVLHALHTGHPGIVRMKALARSYVWWPNIDSDIERVVRRCVPCQETRHNKPHTAVHPWETTKVPWSRIHVDFAGPFQGKVFFIVVDSYSKWLEVSVVKSTSSQSAIKSLRSLFATHGLPDAIVSDNGTAFTSEEFRTFLQDNLIRHIRCAPFHPSSNGQAERMVQTTKDFLKKIPEQVDMDLKLSRFLFTQHITPHSTTGLTPAELLFKRQLKTYFDKIHPNELSVQVEEPVVVRAFSVGDTVWVRNYASSPMWIKGTVESRTGPISYTVRLQDARVVKRHLDQIRSGEIATDYNFNSSNAGDNSTADPSSVSDNDRSSSSQLHGQPDSDLDTCSEPDASIPRRSGRERRAPDFFKASGR